MKKIILVFSIAFCLNASAQTDTTWHGKRCAVVLTYDDGLDVDLSHAIPALDSVGLKGTFYISDYFNGLSAQIAGWKRAAAKGHELANHTVWHPCTGGPGREFVKDYDLRSYTVKRIVDETRTMSNFLKALDGEDKRTFAYPCGDTKIHDTSYIDAMKGDFVAARGVQPQLILIDNVDLYNIGCYGINGQSGDELIALVKQAMQKKALIVFLFHGVGGGHGLNVSLEAHSKLLHFLKDNQRSIWTAPMIDVAEHIRQYQQHKR